MRDNTAQSARSDGSLIVSRGLRDEPAPVNADPLQRMYAGGGGEFMSHVDTEYGVGRNVLDMRVHATKNMENPWTGSLHRTGTKALLPG